MDLCTCVIRHAGNLGMTIHKDEHAPVPVPEILVLKAVHGDDAVINIAFHKQSKRPAAEVLAHLRSFYGDQVVEAIWPGRNPVLPKTLAEAGLLASEEEPAEDEAEEEPPLPPADPAVVERARSRRAAAASLVE
jgi:hypothetical protein